MCSLPAYRILPKEGCPGGLVILLLLLLNSWGTQNHTQGFFGDKINCMAELFFFFLVARTNERSQSIAQNLRIVIMPGSRRPPDIDRP